VNENDENGEMS